MVDDFTLSKGDIGDNTYSEVMAFGLIGAKLALQDI
jgi:hypothetical protein